MHTSCYYPSQDAISYAFQVNRYAGKDVTCSKDENKGTVMFVRGLESERRDVPLFVRTVSKIALQEILLNEDVHAALDACKREIRRLISGKCSMMELVMTGVRSFILYY